MDEVEFEWALRMELEDPDSDAWEDTPIRSVTTYEDAGLLTMNRGLVVRLWDGSEFQVQIVRSGAPSCVVFEDDEGEDE